MREITNNLPKPERWAKITEFVTGKDQKEVVNRFRELVAKAKAGKA